MLNLLISEIKYNWLIYLLAAVLPLLFNLGLILFTPFLHNYDIMKNYQFFWLILSFILVAVLYQKLMKEKRDICWNIIPLKRNKVAIIRSAIYLIFVALYFIPVLFTQTYIEGFTSIKNELVTYSFILVYVIFLLSMALAYMDISNPRLKKFIQGCLFLFFIAVPNLISVIKNNDVVSQSDLFTSLRNFSFHNFIADIFNSSLVFFIISITCISLLTLNVNRYQKRKSYLE